MQKQIAIAANTVVPAVLTLEQMGFAVSVQEKDVLTLLRAIRGEETYIANDPIELLGLVKLIEMRGWNWHADDMEIAAVLKKYENF